MNESKLMAIWKAVPTLTRAILILGTVQYRTEQYIHYKQFRSRHTLKNKAEDRGRDKAVSEKTKVKNVCSRRKAKEKEKSVWKKTK